MNSNVGNWVLFVVALPAVVLGYLWLLLLCAVRVAEWGSLRWQGVGVLTARTTEKAAKKWGFSTTIGRAVLYHPAAYDETVEVDSRIERHEFVHIRQWEDACLWGLVGGVLVAAVAALVGTMSTGEFFAVWGTVYCLSLTMKATNFISAVLRYGPKGIYRDAEHERSAYAQTDLLRFLAGDAKSWEELRDAERAAQKDIIG